MGYFHFFVFVEVYHPKKFLVSSSLQVVKRGWKLRRMESNIYKMDEGEECLEKNQRKGDYFPACRKLKWQIKRLLSCSTKISIIERLTWVG